MRLEDKISECFHYIIILRDCYKFYHEYDKLEDVKFLRLFIKEMIKCEKFDKIDYVLDELKKLYDENYYV